MQTKTKNRTWGIIVIILGAILILVIGFLIGQTFINPDSNGAPSSDEPLNPPASGAVAIQSFTLEPGRMQAGECTTLTWNVSNAEVVTLSRDGKVIYNALTIDSYQDCLDQAGIFRYRLDASNSDGQFFGWSELQVIVE